MNDNIIDSLLERVAENLGVKKPDQKPAKPSNVRASSESAGAFKGDMRISPDVIRTQADIALSQGQTNLSMYLRIASEMAAVGEEALSEIGKAVSGGSYSQKQKVAEMLESKYNAVLLAGIVRK